MSIKITKSKALEEGLERTRNSLEYKTELVKQAFADELWQAMRHRKLSQVHFAEKAGTAKQSLTKIFAGANCTIETMVKLAHVLDYTYDHHLTPNERECDWQEFLKQEPVPTASQRAAEVWGKEEDFRPVEMFRES